MIINLEKIANKLTVALFGDADMDEVDKAKIEYGFNLTLGILIGFAIAVLISVFLNTVYFVTLLLISALGLRVFTGGAHCSSYDRCTLLTLLIFVPLSVLVKYLTVNVGAETITAIYIAMLLIVMISIFPGSKKVMAMMLAINAIIIIVCLLFVDRIPPSLILSIGTGLLVQGLMSTKMGGWFVEKADFLFGIVGI